MKRLLLSLSIVSALCIGIILFTQDSASATGRLRIGVGKFDWEDATIGAALADVLIRELVKSGMYDVVDRETLQKILDEQNIQISGFTESGGQADVTGQIGEVDYLILGRITAYGVKRGGGSYGVGGYSFGQSKETGHVVLDLRLVDIRTSKILWADKVESQKSESGLTIGLPTEQGYAHMQVGSSDWDSSLLGLATLGACEQIIKKLSELLPLQGGILAVSGDIVVIDLNQNTGLKVGDRLKVFKVDQLKDDKGKVVFENLVEAGEIEVSQMSLTNTLCKIVTGTDFASGMVVKPTQEVLDRIKKEKSGGDDKKKKKK